jgi:Tol biopolymer transport system component
VFGLSISGDGRYVAFGSDASNLVPGDTNNETDVFVYDRQTGETTRVSVASDGAQGDRSSSDPDISADGRYVAFASFADNLVPGCPSTTARV